MYASTSATSSSAAWPCSPGTTPRRTTWRRWTQAGRPSSTRVPGCCTGSGCAGPAAAPPLPATCARPWRASDAWAPPWAGRARAELQAAGDPAAAPAPDRTTGLTPQERQIVRLAARGLSNKDIAAQLFLSPRTVGYHLYKAYPKLGVASRGELAALADLG
ncbi:response regulator transcription factor [Nonomuraea thailandensis]